MKPRKPSRGVCGECGCAVVAPSELDRRIASGELRYGGCWDRPIIESGWAHGHEFDGNGKLLKVRCQKHGGLGFPRGPVTDATVQQ